MRVVGALLVAGLLAGCSSSSKGDESDRADTDIATFNRPAEFVPANLVEGSLEVRDRDCVVLKVDGRRERLLTVWPYGSTWHPGTQAVWVPDGEGSPESVFIGRPVVGSGVTYALDDPTVDDLNGTLDDDDLDKLSDCAERTGLESWIGFYPELG